MKPEVVAIKLKDRRIQNLANEVQTKFAVVPKRIDPHVTLQGPFKAPISRDFERRTRAKMPESHALSVNGVGTFKVGAKTVVYLKVAGDPIVRTMWFKPDFPVSKFGRNPHITIFKGSDECAAQVVEYLNKRGTQFHGINCEIERIKVG
jgi:2'-5' RNA ligase